MRLFYLIFFLVSLLLCKEYFVDSKKKYLSQLDGELIAVEIVKKPQCGKSINIVEVEYNQKEYIAQVSKNRCINGEIRIGELLELIYSEKYDTFVYPYRRTKSIYYFSIVLFAVPILSLYSFFKRK